MMEGIEWYLKLEQLKKDSTLLDTYAKEFSDQILEECQSLKDNRYFRVTEFCKFCPKLGTKYNEETGLSTQIAILLKGKRRFTGLLTRLQNKYTFQNEKGYWNWCIDTFIKPGHPISLLPKKEVDQIVYLFSEQLQRDLDNLDNSNYNVSDCCYACPNIDSRSEKRREVAKRIALTLWPLPKDDTESEDEDDEEEESKEDLLENSYTQYTELVERLKQECRRDSSETEHSRKRRLNFKNIIYNCEDNQYDMLRTMRTQKTHQYSEPEPAQLSDLEPILQFLKSNQQPIQKEDSHLDHIRFPKGAISYSHKLDLYRQGVKSHFNLIIDALKGNTFIQHLLLGNNGLEDKEIELLAKVFNDSNPPTSPVYPSKVPPRGEAIPIPESDYPKIRTLELGKNNIKSHGASILLNSLKSNEHVTYLSFKINMLDEGFLPVLEEFLVTNKTLKTLDLTSNNLGDSCLVSIFSALEKNNTLRTLLLSSNGLTQKGVREITSYFQTLIKDGRKGITSLDISNNCLYDEGIASLVEEIYQYPHLKYLNISSNGMTKKSSDIVFRLLADHPQLTTLKLGHVQQEIFIGMMPNKIGDEGLDAVIDYLTKNTRLKVLNITNNRISVDGLKRLAEAYRTNNSLLYLYSSQYGSESSELREVIDEISNRNIGKIGMERKEFENSQLATLYIGKHFANMSSVYYK